MSSVDLTTVLRASAPHAPDALRERVLALEPRRARFAPPPRRLVLVALPAALGVAVAAALVHGVVGSRSPSSTQHAASAWRSVTTAGAATSSHGSGGLVLASPDAPATPARARGPVRSFAPSPAGRLQHTDASLRIGVADTAKLDAATKQATRIAGSLGGYAQSVNYRTPQHGVGTAYLELRVPAQNVKTALTRLVGLGTLVSQRLSVTDLQQKLATQSAQVGELRRRVAALERALRTQALPDAQRVLLQIKLAESKRALAQRLHARKGTIAAGTTARISLAIGTQKAIAPPPQQRGRVGRMLHSAVGFLALEGMVALYGLIVVSPFALVALLLWLWRRRTVERLLAA